MQPASEAEEQAIEQRIADLKQQVESSGNESDAALSTLVSEAETAIDEGDYAQAAEIQRQLEQQLDGSGGGLPLLPIIFIILFGLIAGVGIYLYAGTSESGDDYGRYSSDLGPVRASKESYQYHDRSILDRVTDMLHNFWMYIDRNILHHSRKAGQQAQARINEFRDGASRRARGQQGGMPRGGDFTPRDEED